MPPALAQRLTSLSCRTLLCCGVALLATGCSGHDDDDDDDDERTASIQFVGQVNGTDFTCGTTYTDVGISLPGRYRIDDLRFYVHDVELVEDDGERKSLVLEQDGVWQYEDVALVDLENGCLNGTPETNDLVVGTVAGDDFTGVCFKLGVPFEHNHANAATAASPLNAAGMTWSWLSGMKFLRVDGLGDPGNLDQPFLIHLGSTECPGNQASSPPTGACGYPNLVEVCLNDFDVDEDVIRVDVGRVLAASNVASNTPDTAPGCMSGNSDPECIQIMPRLGLDYTYTAGAGATPEVYPAIDPQQLFSVE